MKQCICSEERHCLQWGQ